MEPLIDSANESLRQLLTCPSDTRIREQQGDLSNPLSFVVNTGSARTANDFLPQFGRTSWIEDVNSGVFFNHARADLDFTIPQPSPRPSARSLAPDQGPKVTLDFLATHDGMSMTLMMSENLQATNWATDPLDPKSNRPFDSEFQIRQAMGFVWFVTGEPNNQLPDVTTANYQDVDWRSLPINGRAQELNTPIRRAYDDRSPPARTGGLAACRPSSNHPGGVNAYFCDGHYRFLTDELDYRVYCRLMSPNDRDVVIAIDLNSQPVTAGKSQAAWDRWVVPVSESEY